MSIDLPETTTTLVNEAIETASSLGMLMYTTNQQLGHAPFSLWPSEYPQPAYQQAYALASSFNQLMTAIVADTAFINEVVAQIASADSFTAKLYQIYTHCQEREPKQTLSLALVRSDYMLQTHTDKSHALRQIEINTISSAFAALSSRVTDLHRYLLKSHTSSQIDNLPVNLAEQGLVDSLASAWQYFADPQALILFIIQPHEKNSIDQRLLQYQLWARHGIKVARCSLTDLHRHVKLNQPTGDLSYGSNADKIAVVYFRAGYTPTDYPGDTEWQARKTIEQSSAIKCPNIAWQLAGTKKMQQRLTEPGVVEQFIADEKQAQSIRSCFASLHSLSEADIRKAAQSAPQDFVLKPQREGGGNNLYGKEMAQTLAAMTSSEFNAWILMERIYAPQTNNILVQNKQFTQQPVAVVSELGIYAACLSRGKELLENRALGHILRTKPASAEEGGVATGVAVLDSPCMVSTVL